MITIILNRNKTRQITGFTVQGHSGYAEHGTDIVCAAVTTAVMTTVNGLTDVVGLPFVPQVKEGYVACRLPETMTNSQRHDADVLLLSMVLSLENIAEQYGDFVRIEEV